MESSFGSLRQKILTRATARLEQALHIETVAPQLTSSECLEKAASILRAQGITETKIFSHLRLEINKLEQSSTKKVAADPKKKTPRLRSPLEKLSTPLIGSLLLRSSLPRKAITTLRRVRSHISA